MSDNRGRDAERLTRGLEALSLTASDETCDRLLAYLELIRKWGKTYNLVAPGELSALVDRHLLDALSIAPLVNSADAQGPLLDVGTGAGFPGMPLAIMTPERETVLLDSAGKKVRFLRHVVRTLGLENVEAVHERVEHFTSSSPFSTITSRAFSSLTDFAAGVRHLAGPETRLLAMKGAEPKEELAALPAWVEVESTLPLQVPGVDARRHVVVLRVNRENNET